MTAEPELPYPVVVVTDLARNYSAEHFRFATGHCRDVIANLVAEDNSSDQQIARVRILRNLDLQLSRAIRWIEEDTDLMAAVMRNLIELKFWAHFVSASPANAARFLSEPDIDGRELFEKLEKIVPAGTYQLPNVPQGKRVKVETSDAEEALLWKMCSKLVHPSAWVLNDPEATIRSTEHRRLFAIYVLFYGWGIVRIFHHIVWE